MLRRLERVRHRQQIVRVAAVDAAPAEMIGKPRRLGALHQRLQPPQMLAIELLGRAEIHRDAMLHDAVLLENLIEHLQRAPAVDHEIFGDDFEPVDDRLLRKDVVVVRNAQADADAVFGESVESIGGHSNSPGSEAERGRRTLAGPPSREAIRRSADY